MDVLTLTNAADAPFLKQQRAALERRGVRFETRCVDGEVSSDQSRGPREYFRFFRRVREALRRGPPGSGEHGGDGPHLESGSRSDEYDLIHAHYGLTAPMALAQRRVPVVLSLWGSDVHGPVYPVSRLCAPFCADVIVMSEAMNAKLGRECRVIPDGVDLETFVPEPQGPARERVGWPDRDEEYVVLFPYAPGRTVKNYQRAQRIVAAVDGTLDRPVSLRTVSGVDHAEMPAYMNAADALLLTSRSEGSPNSVKEAMACRLPVVATDVGDVRERLADVSPSVVGQYDSDLIVGLRDVLESGARSNGREAVREVSLERTTEAILEVYREAVGHVEPTVDEPTATL